MIYFGSLIRNGGFRFREFDVVKCENHDPGVKWASKCDPTDNGSTL